MEASRGETQGLEASEQQKEHPNLQTKAKTSNYEIAKSYKTEQKQGTCLITQTT